MTILWDVTPCTSAEVCRSIRPPPQEFQILQLPLFRFPTLYYSHLIISHFEIRHTNSVSLDRLKFVTNSLHVAVLEKLTTVQVAKELPAYVELCSQIPVNLILSWARLTQFPFSHTCTHARTNAHIHTSFTRYPFALEACLTSNYVLSNTKVTWNYYEGKVDSNWI